MQTLGSFSVVQNPSLTLGKPFPIFTASLALNQTNVPFEFTPWYSGVARTYEDDVAGFIETTAFNSLPPSGLTAPVDGMVGVLPGTPMSLTELMGLSTTRLTDGIQSLVEKTLTKLSGGKIGIDTSHTFNYWSPRYGALSSGESFQFSDGSYVDGLGVHSLLRRQVQKILVLYPASSDVTTSVDTKIARLFGRSGSADGIDAGKINANAKVFSSGDYDTLMNGLSEQKAAGLPYTFRQKCTVLPNAFVGIKGNATVELFWIINSQVKAFENLLPNSTVSALKSQRDTSGPLGAEMIVENFLGDNSFLASNYLTDFPYLPTVTVASPQMVALLKQQTAWIVTNSSDALVDFVTSN